MISTISSPRVPSFVAEGTPFSRRAQLLSGLGARWNSQKRAAINGGHFDLRAQRRFRNRHRNGEMDVITFTMEYRIIAGADDDIEIASGPTVYSGISFSRQSDALSVARASLDADFQRLSSVNYALSAAHSADRACFTGTTAPRAGDVELHSPAGLLNRTLATALRARSRRFQVSMSVAVRTRILPRDVQAHHGSANRLPESYVYLIFEIGSRLRAFWFHASAGATSTSGEHPGEDVSEAATMALLLLLGFRAAKQIREIESAEIVGHFLGAPACIAAAWISSRRKATDAATALRCSRIRFSRGRIDIVRVVSELIVDLALFRIAQDIVGFGDGFESLLRRLVSGIHIRMVLARKFAEALRISWVEALFLMPSAS